MKIKEFIEGYNKCATQQLKDKFVKGKLNITPYVSILKKDTYAQLIIDRTMFEQESYDSNGEIKYRKTDKIRVNSVAQYIQFCRVIIELYTNLEIENGAFIDEYDALKSSGLLDLLMIGSDKAAPVIPMNELSEFRTVLDMKVKDTLENYSTPQAFIERQVDRFKALGEATLVPLMNTLGKKLDEMPKEELEGKILEFVKKGNFKEV